MVAVWSTGRLIIIGSDRNIVDLAITVESTNTPRTETRTFQRQTRPKPRRSPWPAWRVGMADAVPLVCKVGTVLDRPSP